MDYNFYIPKNVTTRFEVVRGIGIKEVTYVGIAVVIGAILAAIVNAITNNFLLAASFVAVLGGGTFIFNMKDNNNQSVVSIVKSIIRFQSLQKFYRYEVKGESYGITNNE